MHVIEYFNLDQTQATVDFVDVDAATDNPVFIDPRAIRLQNGWLNEECTAYLVSFFSEVLDAIRDKRIDHVRELMHRLGEPNETHLGFSRGKSRGRGLTGTRGGDLADSISSSKAAETGLLQDLEDTTLLVPGVGIDLISDMTTHIIRWPLIQYTQDTCRYHGVYMENQYSGPIWNPDSLVWEESFVELPRTPEGKLLLVPKSIVRHVPIFDNKKYFKDYLAPILEGEELQSGSAMVQLLKNGSSKKIPLRKLAAKYGDDKPSIVDQTLRLNRQPLQRYRATVGTITAAPLVNEQLADTVGADQVDFIAVYDKIMAIRPGKAGATMYHHAAEEFLTAVFYPSLINRKIEKTINEGRKRIDIVYDNAATTGFFDWVGRRYNCPTVPVECKNYQRDLNNPELDQMIGRFSDHRGRVGIIVCRSFEDKNAFLKRCRDTCKDGSGFIVALDDEDLQKLAKQAAEFQYDRSKQLRFQFSLLRDRFDLLIS